MNCSESCGSTGNVNNIASQTLLSAAFDLGRVDLYSVDNSEITHITTIEPGNATDSRFGRVVSLDDANLLTVVKDDSGAGAISVFRVWFAKMLFM